MFQLTVIDEYWSRKHGRKFEIKRIWRYTSFCCALIDFEQFVGLPDITLEFIWLDEF